VSVPFVPICTPESIAVRTSFVVDSVAYRLYQGSSLTSLSAYVWLLSYATRGSSDAVRMPKSKNAAENSSAIVDSAHTGSSSWT
jgi:hypothetical protein